MLRWNRDSDASTLSSDALSYRTTDLKSKPKKSPREELELKYLLDPNTRKFAYRIADLESKSDKSAREVLELKYLLNPSTREFVHRMVDLEFKSDKSLREEFELKYLLNPDTRKFAYRIAELESKSDKSPEEVATIERLLSSPLEMKKLHFINIAKKINELIYKEYEKAKLLGRILHISLGERHGDTATTLVEALFIVIAKTVYGIDYYGAEVNEEYLKQLDTLFDYKLGIVPTDPQNSDIILLGDIFLRSICYKQNVEYLPLDSNDRMHASTLLSDQRDKDIASAMKEKGKAIITVTGEAHLASCSFGGELFHTVYISVNNIYSQMKNAENFQELNKQNLENVKCESDAERKSFEKSFAEKTMKLSQMVEQMKEQNKIIDFYISEEDSESLKHFSMEKRCLITDLLIKNLEILYLSGYIKPQNAVACSPITKELSICVNDSETKSETDGDPSTEKKPNLYGRLFKKIPEDGHSEHTVGKNSGKDLSDTHSSEEKIPNAIAVKSPAQGSSASFPDRLFESQQKAQDALIQKESTEKTSINSCSLL